MKTKLIHFTAAFFVIAMVSQLVVAQEEKKKPKQDSAKSEKTETADEKPILAIVGGDIHTVTGAVIRRGTVLVQDGKILDVGQSVTVPKDATVIDATGKTITPGFVAISMRGVGLRSTPSAREKLVDSLDPFDQNIKYSLGVGITSGCLEMSTGRGGRRRRALDGEPTEIFPGLEQPIEEYLSESMLDFGDEDTALCPCCGLPVIPTEPITPAPPTRAQPRKMAVLKMSYGNLEAMLMKENAFYSPSPGALNGAMQRHNWRVELRKTKESIEKEKAKKEAEAKAAKSGSSKTDDKKKPATSQARRGQSRVKPELVQLLKREIAMRIRANTVDEIRDMIQLAEELGYDIVIEGGVEAWVLGQELGAADVSVIYTPRQRRDAQRGREHNTGSFIESTKIFQEAGVPFAIATLGNSISMNGLAGRDLTSLPLEAAFAVRGGADEQTALEALTIAPARMLGLEDRIGSIEKGKDADLLILNGAPLDYRTYVEQAIVAGKVSYDRAKDRVYPVYDRN